MKITFPTTDSEQIARENAKRMDVSFEDYILIAVGYFNDVQAVERGELPERYIRVTQQINDTLNNNAEQAAVEPIIDLTARELADILRKSGIGIS